MRFVGVDLAWGEGTPHRPARETGLVALAADGTVVDAGWARGIDAVTEWVTAATAGHPGSVIAVDAPLVVANPTGMRACEREVGVHFGRHRVGANASNLARPWLGGVTLRRRWEAAGFEYDDGVRPPTAGATSFFECYPYTTLVGAEEFGWPAERPRYKRKPKAVATVQWRALRAAECDAVVARLAGLAGAAIPLVLDSHPVTRELLEPSPVIDADYKHREDLIDAVIAAWTAALWWRMPERCLRLGADSPADAEGRRAVIIAPRRGAPPGPAPTPPVPGRGS